MRSPTFASHKNFFDPALTNDGRPYGPYRYKQIVREAYAISKNTSTSYADVMKLTPNERTYLLEFLDEEARRLQASAEEARRKK